MEGLWKPLVALAGALVVGAWLVLAWASRRRKRRAALEPLAAELGLKFHGDSFRGRYRGHAIRGDALDEIPGRDPGGWSVLAPFSFGKRVARLRVELVSSDVPSPQGAKSLSAVRREIKDSCSGGGTGGTDVRVALHGTEVVLVLRGDAIDAGLARRAIDKAIDETV